MFGIAPKDDTERHIVPDRRLAARAGKILRYDPPVGSIGGRRYWRQPPLDPPTTSYLCKCLDAALLRARLRQKPRAALAPRSSETTHLRPVYSERTRSQKRAAHGDGNGDQAVENDLKQLMADITRTMEKAQEAVASIASKAATATTETDPRLRRVRARHHDSRWLGKC